MRSGAVKRSEIEGRPDLSLSARDYLPPDELMPEMPEFVVSLGSVTDLIEAYDEGDARMGFIERHGIDQTEHDYIEVRRR